ncbi:MAG: hypothetical protein GWP08_17790 [Nitrospiraceae bacterium]|nr:hypothetical protein [Nitrospiraceae bacterium]
MRKRALYSLPIALLAAGCMHTPQYGKPFSQDWVTHTEKDEEIRARKARIKESGEALLGKPGKTRAAVEMDENERPQLNLGRSKGLSADVDFDHLEPDVKLKYRIEW